MNKKQITETDLKERLTQQEARVADLKGDQVEAILNGTKFDTAALRDGESDVEATRAALAEFRRREEARIADEAEAAAAVSDQERRQSHARQVRDLAQAREDAISDMEAAMRGAARAYARAEEARRGLMGALTTAGAGVTHELQPRAQETRLAACTAAVLKPALGQNYFGGMVLRSGFINEDTSWLLGEKPVAAEIERQVAVILGGVEEEA
ncbi:hypothetical protein [Vannielia sp. SX4]|uniref:hypothetical protein n=1 Tax=Vannielia sp. SX4 TaxID=3463852 RepID=UPI004058A95C